MVVEAKTRMCVVRANSRPPPKAGAASAEIVGICNCEIDANVPRNEARKVAVLQSYLLAIRAFFCICKGNVISFQV